MARVGERMLVGLKIAGCPRIRTRTRRTEIVVQRLASPSSLDDQDRAFARALHRQTKSIFGADLAAVFRRILARAVTGRQRTEAFAVLISTAGEIGDPHILRGRRFAVRAEHALQQRRRRGVFADIVDRLDPRMAFHVRLPHEDVDLQRFRRDGARSHDEPREQGVSHISTMPIPAPPATLGRDSTTCCPSCISVGSSILARPRPTKDGRPYPCPPQADTT